MSPVTAVEPQDESTISVGAGQNQPPTGGLRSPQDIPALSVPPFDSAVPRRKRLVDFVVASAASILWGPAVALAAAMVWLTEGRPMFYVSRRRIAGSRTIWLYKLRTMVRDAAQRVNRRTVPITDTRFLNIPLESELYTRVGWWIERFHITELPQFVHVLRGQMSIVGNRPLPEDVVAALVEAYPYAEQRFDVPCGMTGPVQLVGRENIRDEERLRIEIAYAHVCRRGYSVWLDAYIVVTTVFVALGLRRPRTVAEVFRLLQRYAPLPSIGDPVPVPPSLGTGIAPEDSPEVQLAARDQPVESTA